jgi:hypothetical protein
MLVNSKLAVLRDPGQSARHGRSQPIISSVCQKRKPEIRLYPPLLVSQTGGFFNALGSLHGMPSTGLTRSTCPQCCRTVKLAPARLTTRSERRKENEWERERAASRGYLGQRPPGSQRSILILNCRPQERPSSQLGKLSWPSGSSQRRQSRFPDKAGFSSSSHPIIGQSSGPGRCMNADTRCRHWPRISNGFYGWSPAPPPLPGNCLLREQKHETWPGSSGKRSLSPTCHGLLLHNLGTPDTPYLSNAGHSILQ